MIVTVRPATEFDAARIAAVYEPYVLNSPATFELDPPGGDDMRRRIIETMVHYPWLIAESNDGSIVGYTYASQHHVRMAYQWSVDVSIYIDERYHRRGVGTVLYKPLLEILSFQGYCTAYAGITLPNEGSVKLHESVGFKKVGVFQDTGYKLGAWRDVGWWDLQLRAYDLSPKEPVPFNHIAASPLILSMMEPKFTLKQR
jgi:phosphinothricin acetyltransferase